MAKRTSKRQMLQHCGEIGPEDGVDPRELVRRVFEKKPDRKALQLCRQVEKTLGYVLAGELHDDRLRDLWVLSVMPAPHSSHLLATVQTCQPVSPDQPAQIEMALQGYKGVVRSAIAADIHRRKTPDISFRVINPETE